MTLRELKLSGVPKELAMTGRIIFGEEGERFWISGVPKELAMTGRIAYPVRRENDFGFITIDMCG